MLLSHRKKFIFTKTVKTAGTSIESFFEQWCLPEGEWKPKHARKESVCDSGIIGERSKMLSDKTWYNHMSAHNIRELIGHDIWDSYFKFSIVRNPYDKVISGFSMFNRECQEDPIDKQINSFKHWLKEFSRLVEENKTLLADEKIPHFLKPIELALIDKDKLQINEEACLNFYIRYENLYDDIEYICNHLGIPFASEKVPKFKKGIRANHIPIHDYYDEECRALVEGLYRWEFSNFNYNYPD